MQAPAALIERLYHITVLSSISAAGQPCISSNGHCQTPLRRQCQLASPVSRASNTMCQLPVDTGISSLQAKTQVSPKISHSSRCDAHLPAITRPVVVFLLLSAFGPRSLHTCFGCHRKQRTQEADRASAGGKQGIRA